MLKPSSAEERLKALADRVALLEQQIEEADEALATYEALLMRFVLPALLEDATNYRQALLGNALLVLQELDAVPDWLSELVRERFQAPDDALSQGARDDDADADA